MKTSFWGMSILMLLVYGCATIGVTQLKNDLSPKADSCNLEIFTCPSQKVENKRKTIFHLS